jgi:hypothetical protein
MPIPANQMLNIEVHVHGNCAAGGSSNRLSDNSFFFQRTNPALALPTKTQIDAAFQAAIVVPMGAALNARWLQTRNSIRYLDDALDAFVDFSHAVAGAIAGDSMTTIDAAFLLARTGLRGKSYSAKKHLFPMSESDTTSGTDDLFNAACLTRLAAIGTAWLGGFTDASGNIWKPIVFSRKLSQVKVNPTTVVANTIISVAVNKRIGEMKHRRVPSVY